MDFLKYVFFGMECNNLSKIGLIRQEKQRKSLALGKEASELKIPFHREISTFWGAVIFSPSVVLFDSAPLDSSVYSYGNQVSG